MKIMEKLLHLCRREGSSQFMFDQSQSSSLNRVDLLLSSLMGEEEKSLRLSHLVLQPEERQRLPLT